MAIKINKRFYNITNDKIRDIDTINISNKINYRYLCNIDFLNTIERNGSLNVYLCLHGFTHNARFFDNIATQLIEQDKEQPILVISPDFWGRGESPYLQKERQYNYTNYTELVSDMTLSLPRVIYEIFGYKAKASQPLKISLNLIGVSMGGVIAVKFLQKLADDDILCKAIHEQNISIKTVLFNDLSHKISTDSLSKIADILNLPNVYNDIDSLLSRFTREFNFTFPDEVALRLIPSYARLVEDNSYYLMYDKALRSAFWRKDKRIPIAEMLFTDIFHKIFDNFCDIKFHFIFGANSFFASQDDIKEFQDIFQSYIRVNRVTTKIIENEGHPVLGLHYACP